MNEHPQVGAFVKAASLMRENRYWARNPSDQLAFLGALRDVMTEVCFHLDRESLLDPAGLAAFAMAAEVHVRVSWSDPSAESVLLWGVENAIQRALAGLESTDNTGEDKSVKPSSVGQPAPPS